MRMHRVHLYGQTVARCRDHSVLCRPSPKNYLFSRRVTRETPVVASSKTLSHRHLAVSLAFHRHRNISRRAAHSTNCTLIRVTRMHMQSPHVWSNSQSSSFQASRRMCADTCLYPHCRDRYVCCQHEYTSASSSHALTRPNASLAKPYRVAMAWTDLHQHL